MIDYCPVSCLGFVLAAAFLSTFLYSYSMLNRLARRIEQQITWGWMDSPPLCLRVLSFHSCCVFIACSFFLNLRFKLLPKLKKQFITNYCFRVFYAHTWNQFTLTNCFYYMQLQDFCILISITCVKVICHCGKRKCNFKAYRKGRFIWR